MHRPCPGLGAERQKNVKRWTAPQDQTAADPLQGRTECGDCQTKAPARCGTLAFRFRIKDEHRDQGTALRHRRRQHRMIVQAQVPAEPQDQGGKIGHEVSFQFGRIW
jgi:hypothetical protein